MKSIFFVVLMVGIFTLIFLEKWRIGSFNATKAPETVGEWVEKKGDWAQKLEDKPERILFINKDWNTIEHKLNIEQDGGVAVEFLKALQPLIDLKLILTEDSDRTTFQKLAIPILNSKSLKNTKQRKALSLLGRSLIKIGLSPDKDVLTTYRSWLSSKDEITGTVAYEILAKESPLSREWMDLTIKKIKDKDPRTYRLAFGQLEGLVDFSAKRELVLQLEEMFFQLPEDRRAFAARILLTNWSMTKDPRAIAKVALKAKGPGWDEVVIKICERAQQGWISLGDLQKRLDLFSSPYLRMRAKQLLASHTGKDKK